MSNMSFDSIVCVSKCVSVCVADLYDDHALPATAAQSLLCKAARKRKEVRRTILAQNFGLNIFQTERHMTCLDRQVICLLDVYKACSVRGIEPI